MTKSPAISLSTDYNQRIIEPAHYQGVASRTARRQPAPATQLVLTTFETAHQGAAPVVETRVARASTSDWPRRR